MAIHRGPFLDASGRHELRAPIVYLDQSTLVDAFKGKRGEGVDAPTNAELAAIVEEIASRGTLCLSVVHVIELVPWPTREDALAMAAWLDRLNPHWFQMEGSAEDELANEVRRRLGLRTAAAQRLPIHDAMTAAIRENMKSLSREAATDMLTAPDLGSLLRKIHGNAKLSDNHAHARTWSIDLFRRTHNDRSSIPDGTSPEEIKAVTSTKFKVHLQIEARRLISTAPVAFGEDYPSDLEITRTVLEAVDDPTAIPMTKVAHHLQGNVADGITRSNPESRTFKERFASFVWDTRHALAGAVVDVFTCDGYVDSVLTDFRESRGMERQVSMRGRTRAALVAELRRQCQEPRART
jgi:hypothetical protein